MAFPWYGYANESRICLSWRKSLDTGWIHFRKVQLGDLLIDHLLSFCIQSC